MKDNEFNKLINELTDLIRSDIQNLDTNGTLREHIECLSTLLELKDNYGTVD